jgi:phosphate transport system permease protein
MSRVGSVNAIAGIAALVIAIAVLLTAGLAVTQPRSHVLVAGSSTMFPFAAAVAERAPAIDSLVLPMGSGAGIAWFCEGLGPQTPDVAIASRAMTAEEASACRVAGAVPLETLEIGRDGIVLAAHPGSQLRELTLRDLWLALASRVPDPRGGGGWVPNPYRSWHEIRAGLPQLPIRVLGPQATSGTRDTFTKGVLQPQCEAALAGHALPEQERRGCAELRRDGAWADAGEDDDGLVARLGADRGALGLVGFGALVRHPDRVIGVCLEGSCPAADTIADGRYPLSRSLFVYFKPAHRAFAPGLDAFVTGFLDPLATGSDGWLTALGLVTSAQAASPDIPVAAPSVPAAAGGVPPTNPRAVVVALVLLGALLAVAAGTLWMRRAAPVRRGFERAFQATLAASALVAAALLGLVLMTLVWPATGFFSQVSPLAFLGGTHWSPESAIRASQAVGEGAFGVLPVLLGSAMVALIALALALPLALAAALHSFAWAGPRYRRAWRLGTRLAALIPAVVFGLFAALTAGPVIAAAAGSLGLAASARSTLAAGVVVGIMLLPVLAVRLEEALSTVGQSAADAAFGLGATRWEMLRDVVLPDAAPALGAAVLLAVTRALGETVIVLMAAGLVASWSADMLESTSTLTAQMVTLMSGTHALDNVRTQLPFVLGLLLAIIVLPVNAWALRLLRRSNVSPSPVF